MRGCRPRELGETLARRLVEHFRLTAPALAARTATIELALLAEAVELTAQHERRDVVA